jgi:predicted nucleic acid-binding protein
VTIYLDSCAAVKLVHREAETDALRSWLDERAEHTWVSSTILEVEVARVVGRYAPDAAPRLHAVLDMIELSEVTPAVRLLASTVEPVEVRTLDALHLATALLLPAGELTAFVTYDKRLASAGDALNLPVSVPA